MSWALEFVAAKRGMKFVCWELCVRSIDLGHCCSDVLVIRRLHSIHLIPKELCVLVTLSLVVWRPHSIHLNPKEFVAAKRLV